MGSAVHTPWPISERATTIVIFPAGSIRRYAFGENSVPEVSPNPGIRNPMTSPALAAAEVARKARREWESLTTSRGAVNGAANSFIGPTAADIRRHELGDLAVRGMRGFREQSCSRHDLPALAISTLRHVLGDPSLL